jgi:hypothetical protein
MNQQLKKLLMRTAAEMDRRGVGRVVMGPTFDTHLKIDFSITKANTKELEKYRCKKVHTRGGRRFRCVLMNKKHEGRCAIHTKTRGFIFIDGEKKDAS